MLLSLHKNVPPALRGQWKGCSTGGAVTNTGAERRGEGRCAWWHPPPNQTTATHPPALLCKGKNTKQLCSKQFIVFYFFFVRQTHWFLDHSRGWKPFTNLFIWKYKYKIILSTSVMWETAIHIVIFYNRALRKPHTKTWKMLDIYIDRYIYMYIYKKNTHYQSCHQFHTKV